MIARIWRRRVESTGMKDYELFETHDMLPTFLKQPGIVAVVFGRANGYCTSISVWNDMPAVEALATSETFKAMNRKLEETTMSIGEESTEIMEIVGGYLPAAYTGIPREHFI